MSKFLDSHPLKGTSPETLKKLQNAPKDEFGVTHLNLIYSEDEDKMKKFASLLSDYGVEIKH